MSATDAHCLVCRALNVAGNRGADVVIARALTVEASKQYAALRFRADLDADQGSSNR